MATSAVAAAAGLGTASASASAAGAEDLPQQRMKSIQPSDRRRSRSEVSIISSDDDPDEFEDAEEYQQPTTQQQRDALANSPTPVGPNATRYPISAAPSAAATPAPSSLTSTGTAVASADSSIRSTPISSAPGSPRSAANSVTQIAATTHPTQAGFLHVQAVVPSASSSSSSSHQQPAAASSSSSSSTAPTAAAPSSSHPLASPPHPAPVSVGGPAFAQAPEITLSPAGPARPPRPSYSVANPMGAPATAALPAAAAAPPANGFKSNPMPAVAPAPVVVGTANPPRPSAAPVVLPTSTTSTTPFAPPSAVLSQPSSQPVAPSLGYSVPPSPFVIKDLDTGESCELDAAPNVFPEVKAAMTLHTFEAAQQAKAAAGPTLIAGQSAAGGSGSKEPLPPHPAEDTAEKKKTLGFMSRLKQVLHITDRSAELSVASGGGNGENGNASIRVKTRHRTYSDLTDVRLMQTLQQHTGPIWTVAISAQGDFIATGGQDSIVRVWAVMGSTAAKELDDRLRAQKAQQEAAAQQQSVNGVPPSPAAAAHSGDASPGHHSTGSASGSVGSNNSSPILDLPDFDSDYYSHRSDSPVRPVVYPIPLRSYAGHKADVIDLAWSKANFLLSASIDKTVRLWHVSRQKCLCVFQHADFVTAVAFHPIEDRYFVSGSFDKKLRIWNIPEHRVVEWAQTSNIITAATFNPNGNMTVAGLYNGQCVFYQTDGLKYHTQVDAKNRRGKDRKGKKVTGMQFSPDGKTLLVTTNDSRIRLFDLDAFDMVAKFKGTENDELQIRAWFSEDGSKVICGGENHNVYVWSAAEYQSGLHLLQDPTGNGQTTGGDAKDDKKNVLSISSQKPDVKCDSSESFRAFNDTCTSAQFMPLNTVRLITDTDADAAKMRHLIVAAGYQGDLKFFANFGPRKAT